VRAPPLRRCGPCVRTRVAAITPDRNALKVFARVSVLSWRRKVTTYRLRIFYQIWIDTSRRTLCSGRGVGVIMVYGALDGCQTLGPPAPRSRQIEVSHNDEGVTVS
jgi:hypothetical protein